MKVSSAVPLGLRVEAFDLCATAGPKEDVSMGSCGRFISRALTQAHLIDSILGDLPPKLSGRSQINH